MGKMDDAVIDDNKNTIFESDVTVGKLRLFVLLGYK